MLRTAGIDITETIDENSEVFANVQELQQKNLELISRFVVLFE